MVLWTTAAAAASCVNSLQMAYRKVIKSVVRHTVNGGEKTEVKICLKPKTIGNDFGLSPCIRNFQKVPNYSNTCPFNNYIFEFS